MTTRQRTGTQLTIRVAPRAATAPRRACTGAPPGEAATRPVACAGAGASRQLDGTLITVLPRPVAHSHGLAAAWSSIIRIADPAACAIIELPGGATVYRFGARRPAVIGLGLFVGISAGACLGAAR